MSRTRRLRRRVSRLDKALLRRATRGRNPVADPVLTHLSSAADNGKLWFAGAALLTATGRRRPRTAAASGLLGLAFASGVVNGPLKFLWRRDRPPIDPRDTLLPLPKTYSFPSGHSASAFAFAAGVASALPPAAPAVLPLAAAVAYSRVHTGVHYPSDVVVGSAIGAGAGLTAAALAKRVRASSVHHPDAPELAVPIPRRAVLLASPSSGTAHRLDDARAALDQHGFTVEREFEVGEWEQLAALLREAGDDPPLVIAAGGDGTVGAAAGAATGTPAIVFALPLGTSNDIARSLGLPPDPVEAAEQLARCRVVEVDVGTISAGGGTRTFLNAATLGLNVAFAREATKRSLRDRFGGLTYPVAAARAVRRYEPFRCTVEHDGKAATRQIVHLSVSNATVFGGLFGMRVPRASMVDGKLDVIVVEPLTVTRLLIAILDTLIGRHHLVRRVHGMQVRSLRIDGPADHEVAADGEIIGNLPVELSVRPAALRVVTSRIEGVTTVERWSPSSPTT